MLKNSSGYLILLALLLISLPACGAPAKPPVNQPPGGGSVTGGQPAANITVDAHLVETAEAAATQDPILYSTLAPLIPMGTLSVSSSGDLAQVPADYPMPEVGLVRNLQVVQGVSVIYSTPQDVQAVAAFYDAQFPSKGWTKLMSKVYTPQMATVDYTKDTQVLELTLVYDQGNKSTTVKLAPVTK